MFFPCPKPKLRCDPWNGIKAEEDKWNNNKNNNSKILFKNSSKTSFVWYNCYHVLQDGLYREQNIPWLRAHTANESSLTWNGGRKNSPGSRVGLGRVSVKMDKTR